MTGRNSKWPAEMRDQPVIWPADFQEICPPLLNHLCILNTPQFLDRCYNLQSIEVFANISKSAIWSRFRSLRKHTLFSWFMTSDIIKTFKQNIYHVTFFQHITQHTYITFHISTYWMHSFFSQSVNEETTINISITLFLPFIFKRHIWVKLHKTIQISFDFMRTKHIWYRCISSVSVTFHLPNPQRLCLALPLPNPWLDPPSLVTVCHHLTICITILPTPPAPQLFFPFPLPPLATPPLPPALPLPPPFAPPPESDVFPPFPAGFFFA